MPNIIQLFACQSENQPVFWTTKLRSDAITAVTIQSPEGLVPDRDDKQLSFTDHATGLFYEVQGLSFTSGNLELALKLRVPDKVRKDKALGEISLPCCSACTAVVRVLRGLPVICRASKEDFIPDCLFVYFSIPFCCQAAEQRKVRHNHRGVPGRPLRTQVAKRRVTPGPLSCLNNECLRAGSRSFWTTHVAL